MNPEMLVLRVIHVVGAILWAGTSFFMAYFLGPAMAAAGPAAGPVLVALQKRRLFTIIPTVAALTMLAGLRMLWIVSTGYTAAFFATRGGRAYSLGAVCAIAAFTIFMGVGHPAIAASMKLGQRMAQAPEAERPALAAQLGALRARAAKASLGAALLLLLTAMTMAVGRYI